MAFNYVQDFKKIDFRERPELYRVGIGEQGVLLVEPYKSELLRLWRFKTAVHATESAQALTLAFQGYLRARDFAGMDMFRKFLQMRFTRSRRYAITAPGKSIRGRCLGT